MGYLLIKQEIMNVNVNHPSIVKFLSDITNNIVSNISIDQYFTLTEEKKSALTYAVFKIIKSSSEKRVTLGDNEFKAFLVALWKKNEESENYEVAAILNDIIKNYDSINELNKPLKTIKKPLKSEKKPNG
jgi:hypothetical protein